MLVGVAGANVGNYLFQLATGRGLGPNRYGDVVALLTLSTLVSLPFAALQIVVSRYVAQLHAVGNQAMIRSLNRRAMLATFSCAVSVMAVIMALTPVIQRTLSIASGAAVVLTATLTLPTALAPVVWGVAQGLQRFVLLAFSMALGTLVRVVALVAFLLVGLSVWWAIAATLVGTMASVSVPLIRLRTWFRAGATPARVPQLASTRSALAAMAPAAVALVALTSLTQADVLAANVAFGDTTTGFYGAASLIGRLILYLPTAIVAVLLPKVAARAASNRATEDILGLSLLVTGAFCLSATLVYALAPGTIVGIAFGSTYDGARSLLVPFGLAMTAFALLNILAYYHLGKGETTFAWIVGGGAVIQVAAFVVFHASPRELIGDSIAVGTGLLVVHEALTHLKMLRSAGTAAGSLLARVR